MTEGGKDQQPKALHDLIHLHLFTRQVALASLKVGFLEVDIKYDLLSAGSLAQFVYHLHRRLSLQSFSSQR